MAVQSVAEAKAVNVPTTTETAVLLVNGGGSGGGPSPSPFPVLIKGMLNITTGTGTTVVTIRCRIGSVTGTLVDVVEQETMTGGAAGSIPFEFLAQVAGYTPFVITVTQAAATANGTVNQIIAETDG